MIGTVAADAVFGRRKQSGWSAVHVYRASRKNPLDYAKLDTGRVHPRAFRVGSGRVKSDPCLILGPRGARCEEDYGILALKLRRFR